jgi:zinc protease
VLERFKLKSGIDVFLVERHNLPIVSLSLVFDGGSSLDPIGKEGLAAQCIGLMTDGTRELDKIAFEEALADLASSVSSGASADTHAVGLSALKKNLDATLDLWAASLLRPGLRRDEFDRALKRRLAGLQQMKGVPAAVAGRLAGSIIYGERHVYGRFATEASLRALAPEDCGPFIADHVKPAGARLFVVGDVTRAEIEDKIGGRVAGFKGRPRPAPRPGPPAPRKGRVFFVDMPDAPQSVVTLMHEGPKRTAADHPSTSVMSGILGEGFSSRINMNIREKHGYAYGARGAFQYTRADSTYRASASVKTDVTKESVLEMLKEIRGMRDGDPTAEELDREKQGRILSLPARFATGAEALEAYRELVYYGLPLTTYDSYVKNIASVDGAAVRRAARKHLRPERLRLFVVGDGKVVLPKLRELAALPELGGAGEVVVLDADGKPGPPGT